MAEQRRCGNHTHSVLTQRWHRLKHTNTLKRRKTMKLRITNNKEKLIHRICWCL